MATQHQNQSKGGTTSLFSTIRSHEQEKQSPTTRIAVVNKLKDIQNRIYEARHRLQIIRLRNERAANKNQHQSLIQNYKEEIKEFSERKKSVKMDSIIKRSLQREESYERNAEERSKNKQKIIENKELLHTRNQWIYETIRKEKEKNLQLIKKAKAEEELQKKRNRDQIFEKGKKRSQYLKQYSRVKRESTKLAKDEEIKTLQSKIVERKKLLESLQKEQEQFAINPQSSLH